MTSPFNHQEIIQKLAYFGWSPESLSDEVGTTQQIITRKEKSGLLLIVDNRPTIFLSLSGENLSDPNDIYEQLVLGWNLDARLTGIMSKNDTFRVYNTSYKPNRDSVVLGEETPIQEFSLSEVLDINDIQSINNKLLLLSPDTWRTHTYEDFIKSPTGQHRITVDDALLNDLNDWRIALLRNLRERYPEEPIWNLDNTARRLLDEIVFMRFCEDRELTKLTSLFELIRLKDKNLLDAFHELVTQYKTLFDTSIFDPILSENLKPSVSVLQLIILQVVEFYKFDILSVDLLGRIYEEGLRYEVNELKDDISLDLNLGKTKELGVYYTPSYIVEYLTQRAIYLYQLYNKKNTSVVLDPASGSGIFLTTLFKILIQQRDANSLNEKIDVLVNCIFGIDIDESAVRRSAQSLYYILLTGEVRLEGKDLLPELINKNLFIKDSLKERANLVKDKKFDIIVSNPPYRRISGNVLDSYRELYGEFIKSQIDICWLMLVAAIDNLSEGGIVSFIVPDSILKNRDLSLVRKYILDNCCIEEISYLNYNAFSDVNIQNIIIILRRETTEEKRLNHFINICHYITPGVFDAVKRQNISQSGFYDAELNYVFNTQLTESAKILYNKIKNNSIILSSYYNVQQGIKPDPEMILSTPISDHAKKYIVGKDIRSYIVEWGGKYINYFFDQRVQLPNVRMRSPEIFETPKKLVIRQIAGARLVAALDDESYYVDSTAFVITPKNNYPNQFLFLTLAMLNSSLVKFYNNIEYPDQRSVFPRVRAEDIRRLPMPSAQVLQNRSLIERIIAETKALYNDLKSGKITSSSSNFHRNPRVKQIDELIFNLYDVTRSEMSVIIDIIGDK
jgi:adenine-specific DNA-methyltransferase